MTILIYELHPRLFRITIENHTMQATRGSVRRLGRSINLMLLHAPMDDNEINIAFKELMKDREEGLIRFIGVSNFMPEQIDAIYKAAGEYPCCNQIVYMPITKQNRIVEYCNKTKFWLQVIPRCDLT